LTNGTARNPIDENYDTSEETDAGKVNGIGKRASASIGAHVARKSISEDRVRQSSDQPNLEVEALAKERDTLQEEIAQVRKSLEDLQEKHKEELSSVREQLAVTHGEKEQAETQYRNLLGKVSTIRSQLGERLKADAVRNYTDLVNSDADARTGGSGPSEDQN